MILCNAGLKSERGILTMAGCKAAGSSRALLTYVLKVMLPMRQLIYPHDCSISVLDALRRTDSLKGTEFISFKYKKPIVTSSLQELSGPPVSFWKH